MESYPDDPMTYRSIKYIIGGLRDCLTDTYGNPHRLHPFYATVQNGPKVEFTLDVEKAPAESMTIYGDPRLEPPEQRGYRAALEANFYTLNAVPEAELRRSLDGAIETLVRFKLEKPVGRGCTMGFSGRGGQVRLKIFAYKPWPEGDHLTYGMVRDLIIKVKEYFVGEGVWCDLYSTIRIQDPEGRDLGRVLGLVVNRRYKGDPPGLMMGMGSGGNETGTAFDEGSTVRRVSVE